MRRRETVTEIPIFHCADCEYAYFPNKEYPNYRLYLDAKHKLFMCKCIKTTCAHFLTEPQCKLFKRRNNGQIREQT